MTRKRISILMVLCIIIVAAFTCDYRQAEAATSMSSITSDSIKQKQQQIKDAEKEKQAYKNSVTDLQKLKKQLETEKSDLKKYIKELDTNLSELEKNVEDLKQKVSDKEFEIEAMTQELEAAIKTEESQYAAMIVRVRLLYEQNDNYVLEALLSVGSFKDLMNRADYMEKVMNYDREMWENYKQIREYVALCKEELEAEKETLDEAKIALDEQQKALEDLIAQKNRDLDAYQSDINNKEASIAEYEAMIKEEDETIKALELAIAEEKKALLAASGSVLKYDGGMFKFPLATYSRVSDDYGYRIHPILKVEQFHNGVDFASPKGTAIYAAYDGKVVAADYNSSMGNYVMIDHGDNLYTIYMHASSLCCEKGDIVVKGETIAKVGSTGRSTGNHLHFSVRLNGEYVSPWNYLKE